MPNEQVSQAVPTVVHDLWIRVNALQATVAELTRNIDVLANELRRLREIVEKINRA